VRGSQGHASLTLWKLQLLKLKNLKKEIDRETDRVQDNLGYYVMLTGSRTFSIKPGHFQLP